MEASIVTGTPVLLLEAKYADQSDGHIIRSVGVNVTQIGFIAAVHKVGFDDGWGGGLSWVYDVVFPNKGIIERLNPVSFKVTEFESPDIPEMKEARNVRIGDTLKDDDGAKFVVSEMGTVRTHTVDSGTTLYFKGATSIGEMTYLTEVGIQEEIEVYEK